MGQSGQCEASTIRSTPNPPPNHTHTQVGGGKGKWATTPHNRINNTRQHHTALPIVVSVVTATGKRPAPSRTRKLSLTAPMVLHPPGCGRVGHHRAHTTGFGSAFTNDVKADPILLLLLFAQRQGAYALLRYEIRRVRSRALRATPVLPGLATPMA